MEMLAMRDSKEAVMKALQWLATVVFVAAGIVLLCVPANGQAGTAATNSAKFVPTRFTVTDAGTVGKPDVMLIPGLASSKSVWDAEAKLLAPNYRLHILQVGGFAGAPAGPNATGELLPGIVEELHGYIAGAKMQPVVVGHSLGGLLAMMLAEKYPGDVRKLVIVDTLPFYAMLYNPAATVETTKPMADGIKGQMLAIPADQYAAMQGPMMAAMAKSDAGRKAATDGALTSDRAVVVEALYEDMLTDMRPKVAGIETPTLVLYEYDAASKMPDPSVYEGLVKDGYKGMPNVKLVRVEDSKHFIMYDQPVKFDAVLEGWLK
jgi:pimeloyl-ACP methyl ester carboxylesterase